MPAKPQKDKGPPFKPGDIKIKIDTKAAAKAGADLRKMFDRLRERVAKMFLEWLQSEEGQKAIKEAIQKELRR